MIEEDLESDNQMRPPGLLYLRDWLMHPYWSFSARSNLPQGFSQGVCILCGVNPDETWHSNEQGYNWSPLPGLLDVYGFEQLPSFHDAYQLDQQLLEDLETCAGLDLSGPVKPTDAVKFARRKGFQIPWFQTATQFGLIPLDGANKENRSSSVDCARSEIASAAARSKWENDPKKSLRTNEGKELFLLLLKEDFKECRTRDGKIVNAKIARKILEHFELLTVSNENMPAERTVIEDVTRWRDQHRS